MFLPGCSVDKANHVLDQVKSVLNNIDMLDYTIDISYGIAQVDQDQSIDDALQKADERMYAMKQKIHQGIS